MKKTSVKSLYVLTIILCISLLSISVGFSAMSTTLSINGSASFKPVDMIRIISMEQNKLESTTEVSHSHMIDTITALIDINDLNGYATYTVEIKNLGQVDKKLDAIVSDIFSNDDMEYKIDGISIGDVIPSLQTKTFTITFKYKDEITVINDSKLNTKISFIFDDYTDLGDNTKTYDELIFDGTNYIDTGIYLFSEENIRKNFEIYFEIDEVISPFNSQGTLINAMSEISPYPGFVFRHMPNNTQFEYNSPAITTKTYNINSTQRVLFKRINDIYYIKINDDNLVELGEYKTGTTFDVPVTIGASLDANGNPWRYFKGKLTNVYIKLFELEKYTIVFDANGANGIMNNQEIRIDETLALNDNTYTKDDYVFEEWNTKSDGTGTSYANGETVTNLAANGEVVTLYAMWTPKSIYMVNYDANGGTGTVNEQQFIYGEQNNLQNNTFTKNNCKFIEWNTQADGNGDSYSSGQLVSNLTKNSNITLYAIWSRENYSYPNEYVFDGTNYIDTGISLYNSENKNKNYIISFEIVSSNNNSNQATLLNAMYEVQPWPGILFRTYSGSQFEIDMNGGSGSSNTKYNISTTNKVTIKRKNGIIYASINDDEYKQMADHSTIATFDTPVTFGSSLQSNNTPFRYFKGTLKNMEVIVIE